MGCKARAGSIPALRTNGNILWKLGELIGLGGMRKANIIVRQPIQADESAIKTQRDLQRPRAGQGVGRR